MYSRPRASSWARTGSMKREGGQRSRRKEEEERATQREGETQTENTTQIGFWLKYQMAHPPLAAALNLSSSETENPRKVMIVTGISQKMADLLPDPCLPNSHLHFALLFSLSRPNSSPSLFSPATVPLIRRSNTLSRHACPDLRHPRRVVLVRRVGHRPPLLPHQEGRGPSRYDPSFTTKGILASDAQSV